MSVTNIDVWTSTGDRNRCWWMWLILRTWADTRNCVRYGTDTDDLDKYQWVDRYSRIGQVLMTIMTTSNTRINWYWALRRILGTRSDTDGYGWYWWLPLTGQIFETRPSADGSKRGQILMAATNWNEYWSLRQTPMTTTISAKHWARYW